MTAVTVRTLVVFILIIVSMRFMGKRQIGELQPSELVTTILISNFASIPIEEIDLPLIPSLLPILIIVSLEVLVSCVSVKYPAFSRAVSGNHMILIENGVANQTKLSELRMSTEDLMEALRNEGVDDIRDVKLAIIETNGKLNVFGRHDQQNCELRSVFVPVLVDGEFCAPELSFCGANKSEIEKKLREKGVEPENVMLLQRNRNGDEHLILKEVDA